MSQPTGSSSVIYALDIPSPKTVSLHWSALVGNNVDQLPRCYSDAELRSASSGLVCLWNCSSRTWPFRRIRIQLT
jgi:hypothetical protein